jgi:hypothetical protein
MKCKNCGFNNRKGVKFCEQCGEALGQEKAILICPSCGFKNRKGVKFCEQCGSALAGAAAAAQPPPPPPQAQAQPPQVVVIQQEGRKRKLNPALLLLLLLLLIIPACCLLMLFGQVEPPAIVKDIIDPIIDPVREKAQEIFPGLPWPKPINGGNEDENVEEAITCAEFSKIAKAGQIEIFCDEGMLECDVWIPGEELADLWKKEKVTIEYQWEGSTRREADCEPAEALDAQGKKIRDEIACFPKNNMAVNKIDLWISWGDCEEYLIGMEFDREEDEEEVKPAEQKGKCCSTEVELYKSAEYFRDPPKVGTLYLGFGITCNEPWEIDRGEENVDFEAFVGANTDIYWGSGKCELGKDQYTLVCSAPVEDQKNSKTKVVLSYDDICEQEFYFQSPFYGLCPAGQSWCGGRCCSIGYCCDCGSGVGCFSSCSGCIMK